MTLGWLRRAVASRATLPATVVVGGVPAPLVVRRSARARRLTLALDPVGACVVLTLPARGYTAQAAAFLHERAAWLAARAAFPSAVPLHPGAEIPFAGGVVRLAAGARSGLSDGTLSVGGPPERFAARAEAWLRRAARDRLSEASARYAGHVDRRVVAVGVGDPARRWGSCSSDGRLRYSWRLVLAPPWVLEAVAAHEVAHMVHANHGAEFHALADRLSGGDERRARAWLNAHGAALHAVGRDPPHALP